MLIAAVSGRALARAAVEAGLTPLVADFFADADTQEMALACRKLPGPMGRGMRWDTLRPALEALAKTAPAPLLGLVYGSGFEDRPELLARIADRWTLLGNDAETVARIKSPESFFGTLTSLDIQHPRTAIERPAMDAAWLAKRRGGAGGGHIVPSRLRKDASDIYYQERIGGRAVSALFVANGKEAHLLGFSEQWTAPAPRCPWRYGGAVRPALLSDSAAQRITGAVTQAAGAFALKGLASADFLLQGSEAFLLEINARPGATLDIYAGAMQPLLGLHLDALIAGKLPGAGLGLEGAAASAIVFAPKTVNLPRNMVWPDWAADRPKSGERIDKQRPICTVLARAGTRGRAKRLVETRASEVLANIQKFSRGENGEQEERRERNASDGAAERQHQGRAAGPSPHR